MSPSSSTPAPPQGAPAPGQGYSRLWRRVEVLSIVGFWSINLIILWRAWPAAGAHPWVATAAVLLGYVLADFTSGFVHWLFDTWGSPNTPVVGQTVIRAFREHHVDQKAMTHHDYVETNGANCLVAVPFAAAAALIPLTAGGWEAAGLFAQLSITSMNLWVMMTNQFHKWSHMEPSELGPLLPLLQRTRLILEPRHHQRHHTPPFTTYYCITHGWLNWPLHRLRFYRRLERLVTTLTGAVPRRDEFGRDAALAMIAPTPQRRSDGAQIDLRRP